jgi:uncharacterized protein
MKLFVIKGNDGIKVILNFNVWLKSFSLGIGSGILSGTFGIGSAAFIQIGLLVLLNFSLNQSVGTTMMIIIPISLGGGIGYYFEGAIDFLLLTQVLIGTMIGAYIGAKFTILAPRKLLKTATFMVPIIAGIIIII